MEGQVIQFTKKLYEIEDYMTIPFDIDMRAKITKEEMQPHLGESVMRVTLDMTDFLEYNNPFMRRNWQNERGEVCLSWRATEYWPEDNTIKIYIFKDKKPYKIVK